jgi:hypothetical protein
MDRYYAVLALTIVRAETPEQAERYTSEALALSRHVIEISSVLGRTEVPEPKRT